MRAEESINKSRDFYLTLLDKFPALIWRSDINAKCDYFNQTWLDFTGRSMEQEMGDGWAEGVHPEDLPDCLKNFLKAFHARQPFALEYRLRRHDGEYRWIIDHGKAFNDLNGKFAGYMGSCMDFTDRKRAEEALRAGEARFRRIMDSNMQGMLFWNKKGKVTGANDAFLKIVRYTRKDLETGRINWAAMTPPEYAHLNQRALEEIAATGISAMFEKEFFRKDGSRVPILIGAATFEDNPDEGVCFVIDLTERKQAEASLNLFRTLIDQSGDGFEVIDPKTGRFLDINETTCKRLGYTREELLSMSVPDIETVAVDFSSWHKVVEEIHQSHLKIIEGRHRRKDGSTFPVEVSVRYVRLDRDYLVASVRDITERKKREKQLSNREHQVMHLTTSGKSLKEIAGELSISIQTVGTHRSRILKKMGMHNSAELIRYAAENDLID